MENDKQILNLVEELIFDEISTYITEGILENYESFKYNFAKMKPTKELYERLKKDNNWALYDYADDYDNYYPNWQKILVDAFKKALKRNKEKVDAELDFLESDELSDASSNIASGIIAKAIKREQKKMKK